MLKYRQRVSGLVLFCLLLSIALGGCGGGGPGEEPPAPADDPAVRPAGLTSIPADLELDFEPAVAAYAVAEDFSNITNWEQFDDRLSDEAKALLRANAFVVTAGYGEEFFSVYEFNRYGSTVPNFVTTDAMLHTYHLYFSRILKGVEKNHFVDALRELSTSLLAVSEAQYAALKGTAWENAAARNVAFFAVGRALIMPESSYAPAGRPEVGAELALIEAAEGIYPSPVLNMGAADDAATDLLQEDYTQYIPRSHYTSSAELSSYFKAMMWYGRMSFRQSNEDECRSALLMTLALQEDDNLEPWRQIYDVTNFFVGASDDLGVNEYAPVITAAYGERVEIAALPELASEWQAYMAGIAQLEAPAINSIPIYDATLQPDREAAIKGFRFMGQRFALDASIFQRLVYREVGENAAGELRMLPSGMDIPAALGSDTALAILEDSGATEYDGYSENMDKLRGYISAVTPSLWQQNLYWSWLNTLRPLTAVKGEGYPSFMTNEAWAVKELNTFLGSWAELKHDTLLYVKQVYAEMGGGGEEQDDRGYVEPNPLLYARLAALASMSAEDLQARGLLQEQDLASLRLMVELAQKLQVIAEKELTNQPLTEEEYELIRTFGGQLEHFWYEALRDEKNGETVYHRDYPAAIIADVATDPNGSVLEVGTGYVDTICAVVPVEGQLRIAVGAVYSYYEFAQPLSERLTDEQWRQMIGLDPVFDAEEGRIISVEDTAPDNPAWSRAFKAQ